MLMRTWILVLLAAIAAPAADTLTVMTFNVRYPSPDDGANIWENRKDIVVETVRKYAPDIMGTQELFEMQGDYIAEKLPEYVWFGRDRFDGHENEHMGVFYRKDRLRLVEAGDFWLSENPSEPGGMSWGVSLPRMVTWGRFRDRDGLEFYFFNTHFAHRREDAEARKKSAQVIIKQLEAMGLGDTPIVITGDFNAADDGPVHAVFDADYKDAWHLAPSKSGPQTTSSRWKGQREGRRIDWILFKADWTVTSAETIDFNRDGSYPSDHYPVVATFQLH